MIDPEFDPLKLLEELAHEVVRLNQRQQTLENYFVELADQHANIAEHLAGQSDELHNLYNELGKIIIETKQATKNNS